MLSVRQEKLCLSETTDSVISISTPLYVPQPIAEKSHYVQNRLFVGGFPLATASKELGNVFRNYGEIIESNIVQAEIATKCYGFVTFSPKHMTAANLVLLEYSRGRVFSLNGKALIISRAVFKPKKVKVHPEPKLASRIVVDSNMVTQKVYSNTAGKLQELGHDHALTQLNAQFLNLGIMLRESGLKVNESVYNKPSLHPNAAKVEMICPNHQPYAGLNIANFNRVPVYSTTNEEVNARSAVLTTNMPLSYPISY